MKSKDIAISAISASLCAITLIIGLYVEMADLFALVVSSAFITLPLIGKSKVGSFLSFLAGGTIAMIISGFNFAFSVVLPAYFLFFGAYPLVRKILYLKNVKVVAIKIIGLIWCVIAVYGIFFYYSYVMNIPFNDFPEWFPKFITDNLAYFLSILAVIFYFVYDRYVVFVYVFFDRYVGKVIKR